MADEPTNQPREAQQAPPAPAGAFTLGPQDSLEGKLVISGDLRILGNVQGQLEAKGDLTIESDAVVRGPIGAGNIAVRGLLEGDVTARGRLLIAGSGSVAGAMRIARLAVEDDATVNGSISMGSDTSVEESSDQERLTASGSHGDTGPPRRGGARSPQRGGTP